MPIEKVSFKNDRGLTLSGRLDLPLMQPPYPFAIFAHVFTGNKSLNATRHIARSLTMNGIAVLRFDFTGLGDSEGAFEDSNFSTNVKDLMSAAAFLENNYAAPSIVVGHSLGGAASIFAGAQLDSVSAVATIGAPSDPEHVSHMLHNAMDDIENFGEGTITVGGREFTIKKQFVEDLKNKDMKKALDNLNKALLVMHSPQDGIVEIENAANLYHAASHPKSFITLNKADHMLTNKNDAFYAGNVISSWVKRYVAFPEKEKLRTDKQVVSRLEGEHYTTEIMAGRHGIIADESERVGGNDFGPSPYELLGASLSACTAMTIKMLAKKMNWPLEEVQVHVSYLRNYIDDCENCDKPEHYLDKIERVVELKGDDLTTEMKAQLLKVADECPLLKTLNQATEIDTKMNEVF